MEIEGSNKWSTKDHRTHDLETLEFPQYYQEVFHFGAKVSGCSRHPEISVSWETSPNATWESASERHLTFSDLQHQQPHCCPCVTKCNKRLGEQIS